MGIQAAGSAASLLNNIVYANTSDGIVVTSGTGTTVENNTVYQRLGNALVIQGGSQNILLLNNILWADTASGAGYALYVASDSQQGFDSDYNDLYATGVGAVGFWQGFSQAALPNWQDATLQDQDSLSANPLFVTPVQTGVPIGYINATSDGRQDDFHEQSEYGTFTGGSLAPVLGTNGLPMYLTATLTTYAQQSPVIDRGDPASSYANEPQPNGGYVNLGGYGNTSQASESPAQFVLVTNPVGSEIWPENQTFAIDWRYYLPGDTGGSQVNIDLYELVSGSPVFVQNIVTQAPNNGVYDWTIPATITPGSNYLVQVTRLPHNDGTTIIGTSVAPFTIAAPQYNYYVSPSNKTTFDSQDWTSAAGNDANSGLDPAHPKATIAGVLNAYPLLGAGATIWVDDGNYALSSNITLSAANAGLRIVGYNATLLPPGLPSGFVASPTRSTVLSRGNTNSGSYVFNVSGTTGVTLEDLGITGAYAGVYSGSSAVSNQLTLNNDAFSGNYYYDVDAYGQQVAVQNSTFSSADSYAIDINGAEATVAGNALTGNASANTYGIDVTGASPVITNNTLENLRYYGIELSSSGGGQVTNNVLENDYANGYAMYIAGPYPGAAVQVAGNTVYSTTAASGTGIYVFYAVSVGPATINGVTYGLNTVYGYSGNGGTGIALYGSSLDATATGNIVYGNSTGIDIGGASEGWDGTASDDRVYDNSAYGIQAYANSQVLGNYVYSNGVGIAASSATSGVEVVNNLVYANTAAGIEVGQLYTDNGTQVINNTVYQVVGNALQVGGTNAAQNVSVRNNILWTQAGYDLDVAANSQQGFTSDYNDLYDTAGGQVALWGTYAFPFNAAAADPLVNWQYDLNLDLHSLAVDPQFVDSATDNFQVAAGSPTIDAGDPSDLYLQEPQPDGAWVNLGYTGNTSQATASAPQALDWLNPLVASKLQQGEQVTLQWGSSGLSAQGPVALIDAGGALAVGDWSANAYETSSGGSSGTISTSVNTSLVTNPAPQAVYQTYASASSPASARTWSMRCRSPTAPIRCGWTSSSRRTAPSARGRSVSSCKRTRSRASRLSTSTRPPEPWTRPPR